MRGQVVLTVLAWIPFGIGVGFLSLWLFGWKVYFNPMMAAILFLPAVLWCWIAAYLSWREDQ